MLTWFLTFAAIVYCLTTFCCLWIAWVFEVPFTEKPRGLTWEQIKTSFGWPYYFVADFVALFRKKK